MGLVRGLWREFYGPEPEALPPYTPDWAERDAGEALFSAALRHLSERAPYTAEPGDVLLFRINARGPIKHVGVLAPGARLIHAYWGRAVCETSITPWWRRRIAAAFAFPEVS